MDEKQDQDKEPTISQVPETPAPKEPSTLILPHQDRFTTYLFSTFQKTTNAVFVLLLVIAVPVTMVLLSRQQDVRQRADFQVGTTPTPSKYNISGKVYLDTNGNRELDSWEQGPANITVTLSSDKVNIQSTTDSYGNYTFENFGGLVPGSYIVSSAPPAGYMAETSNSVNVKLGPSNAVVNFGLVRRSSPNSAKTP